MIKKTICRCLAVAFGSLAVFASCSTAEEDNMAVASSGGVISFTASTEYSRSGDITTNNLKTFNVYAYTGGSGSAGVLMNNVTVTKNGNNVWTYSPTVYWPAKETVDFYAFSPASWVGSANPLGPVAYYDYPGTDDIVYAVSTGLTGGTINPQVVLNFRHALSKVTVKMRSSDENLLVKVSNVAIANIMAKGNFYFPEKSSSEEPAADNTGVWSDQNTPLVYMYHMSQDAGDLITLTTTATDMSDTGMKLGGGKFLIPQTLSYRSGGSGSDTYLTVSCSIYDAKSGVKLWPNANTPAENIVEGSTFGDGVLKFPLGTSEFQAWQPGVHYIYNLTINNNEEMGAIEFGNPNVDSYVNVESIYD